MPQITVTLTDAQSERLAWLAKSLAMYGAVKATPDEIIGTLIMTVQREELERAVSDR